MQGITTENLGLDSLSVAPVSDEHKKSWATHISGLDGIAKHPWNWNSFASWLDVLDGVNPSVNLSSYAGLGTIRLHVMGMDGVRFYTELKNVTATWFREDGGKVDTWDGMLPTAR